MDTNSQELRYPSKITFGRKYPLIQTQSGEKITSLSSRDTAGLENSNL